MRSSDGTKHLGDLVLSKASLIWCPGRTTPNSNHVHMVALYTVWYNWVRIHKTLKVTPAVAAGLTDKLLSMEDVAAMIDAASVSN